MPLFSDPAAEWNGRPDCSSKPCRQHSSKSASPSIPACDPFAVLLVTETLELSRSSYRIWRCLPDTSRPATDSHLYRVAARAIPSGIPVSAEESDIPLPRRFLEIGRAHV